MFLKQFLSIDGRSHHDKSYGIYDRILKICCTSLNITASTHILQEDLGKIFHKGNRLSN